MKTTWIKSYIKSRIDRSVLIIIGILIIMAGASFLRLYHIGARDVWLDEANSVLIAEHPNVEIFTRLKHDSSPPLYYLILKYWMSLFGNHPGALRLLSAVFGIFLILIIYWVGRSLISPEAGFYSAFFCAISPIQIFYSQEIRMYTLLPLTSLLSVYFFILYLKRDELIYLVGLIIMTATSLYIHNYAFLLLPAFALVLCIYKFQIKTIITGLICLVCLFILYMPWIYIFLFQLRNQSHYVWLTPFFNEYGIVGSLFATFQSFSPGGAQPIYIPLNSFPFGVLVPAICVVIILVYGFIALFFSEHIPLIWRPIYVKLAIFLLCPIIIALVISVIRQPIYVAGRCDQLVFPFFCLIVGMSISMMKTRSHRYIAMGVLLICAGLTLHQYYTSNLKYGNKAMASVIKEHLKPGDAVVCTGRTRAPIEYYLQAEREYIGIYSYPREMTEHLGNQDINKMLREQNILIRDATFIMQELCHKAPRTVYILYVHNSVNNILLNTFIKYFKLKNVKIVGCYRQSVLKLRVEIIKLDVSKI